MKLPSEEICQKDPLLNMFRSGDAREYLNPSKGANQYFLNRRRIDHAFELLTKHLSKDTSAPVADFACGTANFGIKLAEAGYEVDLIDNEKKYFDYVKLKTDAIDKLNFIEADASKYVSGKKYFAIFFGEAIEHMADPEVALKNLYDNLLSGGLLCLTTPNGDYVDCTEPKWGEVRDQKERNAKLANNIGNHVCEFGFRELEELVRNAGFGLLEHQVLNSKQISRRSILRRILPMSVLNEMDKRWSRSNDSNGRSYGRIQVLVAQRFH